MGRSDKVTFDPDEFLAHYKNSDGAIDVEAFMSDNGFDSVEDFLEHYGIKGMKWGVRRSDAELSRANPKKEESSGSSTKTSESTSSSSSSSTPRVIKGIDDLTTSELQQLVNRLNLEQQYSKLTATPPKEQSEAKLFVQGLMKEVAKESTRAIARGVGRKAVKKIGKKYKFEPVYSKK